MGHNALADPIKQGVPIGADSGRGLRKVAGPELHEINFRVPLEPPASKVNRAFQEHIRRESAKAIFQRHSFPINLIGGFKFPDAPEIAWHPASSPRDRSAEPSIGDGLEIPAFLDRKLWGAS